jgi:hypothetical protein
MAWDARTRTRVAQCDASLATVHMKRRRESTLSQLSHTALTLAHSTLFSGYSHLGLSTGSLQSASVKTCLV